MTDALYDKVCRHIPFTSFHSVWTLFLACKRIPVGARVRSYDATHGLVKDDNGQDVVMLTAGFVGTVIRDVTTATSTSTVSGRLFPDCGVICAPGEAIASVVALDGAMALFCEDVFGMDALEVGPRPDFLQGDFSDAIREGCKTMWRKATSTREVPKCNG